MNDIFDENLFDLNGGPVDADSEFIPLITQEEEDDMHNAEYPTDIPILALRNNVLFPGVVIPITVGRDKSIKLVQHANENDKIVGVVSQKNQEIEEPEFKDLHKVGTLAQIVRMLKMPDGSTTVIIQGKRRFQLEDLVQEEPFLRANVKFFKEEKAPKKSKEFTAIIQSMKELALKIIKDSPNIPS
jgi:ATP-dependent Lon protease